MLEYQTKGLDCFESDESFSKDFGVSQSTVSRAIGNLKKKNIIVANTKNTQKGKLRYLTVLTSTIEECRKRQNDFCENSSDEVRNSQIDSCGNVNLPISNKQNESIKDNIKDNSIKDNENVSSPRGKEDAIKDVMKDSTNSDGSFRY